jgi:hypothetical protein
MFAAKDQLLTRPNAGGYQISRSLRFNSPDSAYLNRTPATTTSQTTATLSAWVKRGVLANECRIMADSSGSGSIFWLFFNSSDQLQVYTNGTAVGLTTTQVFRDPSAWYHIVVNIDTTQATASNRVKLYLNGAQITAFIGTQTYYSLNEAVKINVTTVTTYLGMNNTATFNGYMTEFNWIDGQALTPSSFGETNAQTGVWQPKAYSGSYGTNGFYLNFSDNSNTTAATLGKDYSGNGNNWTPNNFSVTAGVGNDSLVDSPTSYGSDSGVGGTVRGNYGTLNPLDKGSNVTLANGNLDWSGTLAGLVRGTIAAKSDKYYFECVASTSYFLGFALTSATASLSANPAAGAPSGYWGWAIDDNSNNFYFYSDGTNPFTASRVTSAGDIYQLAVDATNSSSVKLWVGVNNTWYNSTGGTTGDPATGANPTVTITSGVDLFPSGCNTNSTNAVSMNFGQRPFAYTAPSGFKALCTQNLPTPTIGATTATQAGKYFNTVIYTGTGANPITITGVGFQPDWVWGKTRSTSANNIVFDAVRGVSSLSALGLLTDTTGAEANYYTVNGGVTAFTSDGFTASGGVTNSNFNANGVTYVAWNWKANGSGSTNTAGQITSTVSANTTSGFSIVTFTTDGTTKTVGHGLGVKPSLVIVKVRNGAGSWITMTDIINGSMQYGALNSTAAFASIGYSAPTSTVFQYNDNNANTQVAYCFAPVAGYSAFGSYTGNFDTNGPFVFTGFRPAYVLIKATSISSNNWFIYDITRSTYNLTQQPLLANATDTELNSSNYGIDLLSNGFKIRAIDSNINTNNATYIYMAFASAPLKYSLAR